MPMVMCKWCEYVGSGDDLDGQWDDVRKHEEKEHSKEIEEEG